MKSENGNRLEALLEGLIEHPVLIVLGGLAALTLVIWALAQTGRPPVAAYTAGTDSPQGADMPVVQVVRNADTGCSVEYFWQGQRLVAVLPRYRSDGRMDCRR